MTKQDPDNMSQFHFVRFVYPRGMINTLSFEKTFEQQNMQHGQKLVLLGQKSFTWDLNHKGQNISLLNNCLTANKKQEVDFETVLATFGFNQSRHYWEIVIDAFVEMEDIYVGIAKQNLNLYTCALESE